MGSVGRWELVQFLDKELTVEVKLFSKSFSTTTGEEYSTVRNGEGRVRKCEVSEGTW